MKRIGVLFGSLGYAVMYSFRHPARLPLKVVKKVILFFSFINFAVNRHNKIKKQSSYSSTYCAALKCYCSI